MLVARALGGVGGAGVGGAGVGNGILLTLPQVTSGLDFLPPLLLGFSQQIFLLSKVQNKHVFKVGIDYVEHFAQQSAGGLLRLCAHKTAACNRILYRCISGQKMMREEPHSHQEQFASSFSNLELLKPRFSTSHHYSPNSKETRLGRFGYSGCNQPQTEGGRRLVISKGGW